MKNLFILVLCSVFLLMIACTSFKPAAQSERQIETDSTPNNPKEIKSANQSSQTNAVGEQNAETGEIISCAPERLYRGESVEIVFTKKHGGKMMIFREPRENFFFIDSTEQGSSPRLTEGEIENSERLTLNTETTRKTNYAKADASGNYTIVERVFNKTGWYRIVIGREALDVEFESMPVTGMCRIYYVNRKRPK